MTSTPASAAPAGTDEPVVVDVNGTTIWTITMGRGLPILVLHGGLGVDHTLYRATFGPLEDGCRLTYIDHRGNGRSGRPALETITIEQLADDAAAALEALGIDRPVVLGHSFGGFVAQELALRHAEAVGGLVLLSTGPGQLGAGETSAVAGPPPPEVSEQLARRPTNDVEMADGMRELFSLFLHRRDPSTVVPLLQETIFSAAAFLYGFESLARWSSVDRLGSIDVPTLVVSGRHDVFTSPPGAERIASRIARSTSVTFGSSGHMPWLDEPDDFFAVVGGWLRQRHAR